MFRIANRHMAGESLVEAVVAEETERRSQALLAMKTLLLE